MEGQMTIATFDDLGVARIARGKLEGAGIPCFLLNEHIVGVNPLYANLVHGIDLIVLFGLPLKFGKSAYTCRICGWKWRDGKETSGRDDGKGPVT